MNDHQIRKELVAAHTPEQIRDRLSADIEQSYLRDWVYGAVDGIVTTFAVVSGVAGAGLSSGIVLILGMANLIGDGFSMAAANYLGVRADQQLREKMRRTEHLHIRHYPEGEREEIRQIFYDKGFRDDDLERAVNIITADVERWVDTMLREEHGLSLDGPSPRRAAAATFSAFLLAGALPLVPFIFDYISPFEGPFLLSAVVTALAFFMVGVTKSTFVQRKWYWAGLETLFIGGVAATLAYFAGWLLQGLADGAA